jgi:sarcosine oxidase subunit beta
MTRSVDVLVVGAGVNGLGTAHRLAKAGVDDVAVVEKKYPMYGGSGRNGGGVRAQWASLSNLELARDSIEAWHDYAGELGLHTWFRQSGYLMLARTDDKLDAMRQRARFQRQHGISTHLVSAEEAQEIAPAVDMDPYIGASFCPEDAVIFPWPVVNGLREAIQRHDVDLHTRTPVTAIATDGDEIARVTTPDGAFEPDWVVNAAGAWSSELARMAGVELPNTPVRHQIFVTEALRPMLDPMVVDMHTGLYVNQDGRGEFVCGLGDRTPREGVTHDASFDFLARAADQLTDLIPSLGSVHAMRQWAGCYDVTPDHVPNLGPHPELGNFVQCNGFSGHGFMVSPVATEITKRVILGEDPSYPMARYHVDRFEKGTVDAEAMVVG